MPDYNFDSIFGDNMDGDISFDRMFGAEDDGRLIDAVLGEAEGMDGDFDELHNNDMNADPDDIDDAVGPDDDTDNVEDDAEGSNSNMVDMAAGLSEADTDDPDDFLGIDDNEIEDDIMGRKKTNIDTSHLDDESEDLINAVVGEGGDCDGGDEDYDMGDDDEESGVEESISMLESDDEDDDYEHGDGDLADLVEGN